MTAPTAFNALLAALPEVIVAFTGLLALTVDLAFTHRRSLATRWNAGAVLACGGCVAAILLLILHPQQIALNDGMLIINPLTQLVQGVLAAFTILVVLLSIGSDFTHHVGEYLSIVLFATSAMMVLTSTQNLLVIFASLEMLSLSLYILAGFGKRSRQSAEGALKYFLFGGMAAGFFLFGISLLYGISGSIDLRAIAAALQAHDFTPLTAVAIVMIVTGLGFKVAAAPFHFWAPDAYQGAPTPSAGLIASSSKIASFVVFAVVMMLGLSAGTGSMQAAASHWGLVIAVVAAVSMVVGNLGALAQSSFRRLLAYSAVGHAGYMLLGILANNAAGLRSLLFYVITYALATLGAFGVLAALEKQGIDRITDFAGLYRRSPLLSFCMLIFLLSLAGIPPLSGFFGKFYVFSSAYFANPGLLWLVALAIAMSVVSLYYYLKILKQIYVRDSSVPAETVETPLTLRTVVSIIAVLVLVLGCYPDILLRWISGAMPH